METIRVGRSAPSFRLPPPYPATAWADLVFAVRTTVASLLALAIAFALQMEEPQWAAGSVWIVAQADRGMSLSKALYRATGTIAGAAVALGLAAAFAQARVHFLVSLALWLGACSAVATAFRHFRAYSIVLAGYTAAIVGLGAASAPEHAFDLAVARTAHVLIGILCEALLAYLLSPRAGPAPLLAGIGRYLADIDRASAAILRDPRGAPAPHALFRDALTLETALRFAATSTGEIRRLGDHVRLALVSALAQLVAAHALRATDGAPEARAAAAEFFDAPPADPTMLAPMRDFVGRLRALLPARARAGASAEELAALDRIAELVAARVDAHAARFACDGSGPRAPRVRFRTHVDRTTAFWNGLRTTSAVLAASLLWILSAWPSGAGFVAIVAVVCALFSTRDRPVEAGKAFLAGTVAAMAMAVLYDLALLPMATGFEMLAALLAPSLVCAGLCMRRPALAPAAAGYTLFFWNILAPENAAIAEAPEIFNGGLAIVAGIAFGTVAFALVRPPRPTALERRLSAAIRRDVGTALAVRRPARAWRSYLTRGADRIAFWHRISAGDAATRRDALGGAQVDALARIHVIVRLRVLAEQDARIGDAVAAPFRALATGDPAAAAMVAATAADTLLPAPAADDDGGAERATAAALLATLHHLLAQAR